MQGKIVNLQSKISAIWTLKLKKYLRMKRL